MTSPANVVQQMAAQGPPGIVATSTTTTALLAQVADAAFPDGSQAFVTGVGYYGLSRTSTATVDGYLVVATASGNGRWLLHFPLAVANTAWLVTDWYLDGTNGVDSNSGTDAQHPVKTITGGIIAKWGTRSPVLPQATTIHVLATQAIGLERAFLQPVMVGASSPFTIIGTTANVGNAFPSGAVTAKVKGNPGVRLQIANMPAGAASGILVFNSTRQSYAFIDSMASNTATMTQPFAAADLTTVKTYPAPALVDTWATNDTLKMLSLPVLNLVALYVSGGDSNTAETSPVAWMQWVSIPDVSTANGNSVFTFKPLGLGGVMSMCSTGAYCMADGTDTTYGTFVMGCASMGGLAIFNAELWGGFTNRLSASGPYTYCYGATVHLACSIEDVVLSCAEVYSDCTWSFYAGLLVLQPGGSNGYAGLLWGPGTLNVIGANVAVHNQTTNTWAASFFWTIGTPSLGWATSHNGITYGPFTVTPANLDTYGVMRTLVNGVTFASVVATDPPVPVTWTQTTWFWDPANSSGTASDNNDGKTSGTALGTFAGFISKMGTDRPTLPYGQSLTLNMISAQPAGADPVFFQPKLSNGGQIILDCRTAWVNAGAAYALGALSGGYGYAGAVASAGGIEMTQASPPGYVAPGVLLSNTTRSSYAVADTATTISQPQTVASLTAIGALPPAPVVDNDWVAGDNIQPITLPNVNLKGWSAFGGDASVGGQPCASWVIGASVPDTSGSAGSEFPLQSSAAIAAFSCCAFLPRVHTGAFGGRSFALYPLGCYFAQAILHTGGDIEIFGGVLKNGLTANGGQAILTNNAVAHAAIAALGGGVIEALTGGCFADGDWSSGGGAGGYFLIVGTLWGSFTVTLGPMATFMNATGSTFVLKALLTNGALKFGTSTTGSKYQGAGVFVDGISLTPTNIDTGGTGGVGLQYPLTGARFCNPQ